MHRRDIFYINWRPVLNFEDNVFDVLDLFDVAAAADVILGRCNLGNLAAHIGIARLDRIDDVAKCNVVGDERIWIEIDLILLHETTNRRDFGDTFHRGKRVTQIPILNGAQLGEVVLSGVVNKRVFINPTDTGRVGADDRIYALWQRSAYRVEIFNNAGARPVNIRAVLENDVDERLPEHGFAADELHFWRRNEF